MAAKRVKKPRCKWLKSCNHEPFSVECISSFFGMGSNPIVFVGEYGFRSVRDLRRLQEAVERAVEWLEDQRQ